MLEQKVTANPDEFSGQIAVITGSGSGIGKSVAMALAARGATVCLLGRNLVRLHKICDEIAKTGGRAQCYQVDLTQDKDVQQLQRRIRGDFGEIDILIHSAGTIALGGIEGPAVEDFDQQYRINVRAVFCLTQGLLPFLKTRRGQIVFFNSSAGLIANANALQYSATKHALKAIADSMREEVNPIGLRVLSVYVGRTATSMQARLHSIEGKTYRPERLLQPEDVASVVLNALSLPRTAEVTDITIRPLTKPS
ncbi:MAG: SDR family oxidoreductase [Candidatus Binatia bacterium]